MKRCKISKDWDLGKTKITDKIRVSSAAIARRESFGNYYLIETWCFSDDPRQKSFQVVHGSKSSLDFNDLEPEDCLEAKKIHRYISDNLIKKFKNYNTARE